MSGYVRAYEGKEPYIFVSYAHRDSEQVLPIIRELYERKYRVWYDEGIAPGSSWPQNIADHLQKAGAVIVFVSENSLASINCKNEVKVARENKKKTIFVSIDGSFENKAPNSNILFYKENILDALIEEGLSGGEFIGDGKSGYEYSIDIKRRANAWNLILGLAAVLAAVFAVSLYGLYNGWFDSILPAKQPVSVTAAPTSTHREAISIKNNLIGSILPVKFTSDAEKNAVYQKLGWTQPYEMTYKDLIEMTGITLLEISKEPIYDISFAIYLPNLEVISLSGSHVTDLSLLAECPKLKTVQVTADMLPITLPVEWDFEIQVV